MANTAIVTATNIQNALTALDSIGVNGVSVSVQSLPTAAYQFRITFISAQLQGDVEDILVSSQFNRVTGSNPSLKVFTNGEKPGTFLWWIFLFIEIVSCFNFFSPNYLFLFLTECDLSWVVTWDTSTN